MMKTTQRIVMNLEDVEKRAREIRKLDAIGETNDANDAEHTLFADVLASIAMGAEVPTQLAQKALRARRGLR